MADDDVVIESAREGMEKSIDALSKEFAKIRTGRANPALLEGVQVDYYGAATPLRSLASVTAPEPRLLVVQPFDPGTLADLERAILKADLGLTPQSDGKVLRVPIPELTEERRKDLVRAVKKVAEDHKVGVRGARRDAISMLKDLEKDGDLAEDDSHRAQKKVQDLTDDFVKQIDESLEAKEQEILSI